VLQKLLLLFLRLVNLTFGGGDPTMAACLSELVEKRKWLTREQYALVFGLARITPGTNLIAFSIGVGWLLRRWPGALGVAVVSTVPAACAVVWFTFAYENFQRNSLAMAAIAGMVAAAIGLMIGASIQLIRPQWKHLRTLAIAGLSLYLGAILKWSPIWILTLGAALGVLWPKSLSSGKEHAS
jgi:chromate transporter